MITTALEMTVTVEDAIDPDRVVLVVSMTKNHIPMGHKREIKRESFESYPDLCTMYAVDEAVNKLRLAIKKHDESLTVS